MKHSVQEIRAAAEVAVTARHAADAAKAAYDANPSDESLKGAWEQAEQKATETKNAADALSQEPTPKFTPEQIAKKKRKLSIIQTELREAGELGDDTDDDEDEDDDDDKPVTRGDLKRMRTNEAKQTTQQMINAIQDPVARAAVQEAAGRIVPSGDPEKDYRDAVALANSTKNSKVLEELQRAPIRVTHGSGAGAPPKPADAEFVPTAFEKQMMQFGKLTKEDVLNARKKAMEQFPQATQ